LAHMHSASESPCTKSRSTHSSTSNSPLPHSKPHSYHTSPPPTYPWRPASTCQRHAPDRTPASKTSFPRARHQHCLSTQSQPFSPRRPNKQSRRCRRNYKLNCNTSNAHHSPTRPARLRQRPPRDALIPTAAPHTATSPRISTFMLLNTSSSRSQNSRVFAADYGSKHNRRIPSELFVPACRWYLGMPQLRSSTPWPAPALPSVEPMPGNR
jgi:hypothetical protein